MNFCDCHHTFAKYGQFLKGKEGRDWKTCTNLGKSLTPTLMMSVDLKKGGDLQPSK